MVIIRVKFAFSLSVFQPCKFPDTSHCFAEEQVIRFLSLKFTLKGKSHSLERIRCFCLLAEDKEVTNHSSALLWVGLADKEG